MGLDPRIGQSYLEAGLGYGGYCLPKDTRGFIHVGQELGVDLSLLKRVEAINDARIDRILERLARQMGEIDGKQIGVLGLAFKPGTDDVRDSPSLRVVERIQEIGAVLRLHDPRAMPEAAELFPEVAGKLSYEDTPYDAARGSDALLILTAWPEYRHLDLVRLHHLMAGRVIVDGRNVLDPAEARNLGFDYSSMGRP
jgi:UDPglucose 6-dehydrogenase